MKNVLQITNLLVKVQEESNTGNTSVLSGSLREDILNFVVTNSCAPNNAIGTFAEMIDMLDIPSLHIQEVLSEVGCCMDYCQEMDMIHDEMNDELQDILQREAFESMYEFTDSDHIKYLSLHKDVDISDDLPF